MKNDALKNIFVYALIAACAFLLNRGGGCSMKNVPETIYVPRLDTVTRWNIPETPSQLQELVSQDPQLKAWLKKAFEKVIYRHDTIYDQVMMPVPASVVDTPVMILLAEPEWSEDVKLFEGEAKGANGNCLFRYLAGVQFDSLQFIAIEGECQHKIEVLSVDFPPSVPLDLLKSVSSAPALQVGAKIGWSPSYRGMSYGVQSTWKGIYGATNYLPGEKTWMFEAGVMFPLFREKREKEILKNF